MKPDPKLEMIGHNVVIDNGTYTMKGGFSTADSPQCRLASMVGHGRHKVSGRQSRGGSVVSGNVQGAMS